MKIFGYSENAAPTKLTGRSFRQASDTRKEENHANSKKVAPTRPEVPPPFPLYIEALFSGMTEWRQSRPPVT